MLPMSPKPIIAIWKWSLFCLFRLLSKGPVNLDEHVVEDRVGGFVAWVVGGRHQTVRAAQGRGCHLRSLGHDLVAADDGAASDLRQRPRAGETRPLELLPAEAGRDEALAELDCKLGGHGRRPGRGGGGCRGWRGGGCASAAKLM